jgi:N-acetylglucosamine malate deacetylase 2
MRNILNIIKRNKGKTLLAVFPHPDDESFTAGGLFQRAIKEGVKVKLICLTKGASGLNSYGSGDLKALREKEFTAACVFLGITDYDLYDYPDAKLKQISEVWMEVVKKEIKKEKPAIVLTFDHSGITGHPDHIATSVEIHKYIKRMRVKPALFWRSPDSQEAERFRENKAIGYASTPNYRYDLSFKEALVKMLAIFSHKSQMQDFNFRMNIMQMILLKRYEHFHKVDFKSKYPFKYVPYKIYPNYAQMQAGKAKQ